MFGNIAFFNRGLLHVRKLSPFFSNAIRLYAAYSSEDKYYILQKINERDISSKGLGANHVKNIFDYVEKNKLSSLEDLLRINGIGPKVLRKICDKILAERDGSGGTSVVTKKRRDVFLVSPPVDVKKTVLLNLVALHIGVESVSWALVNTLSKDLIDWNLTEGPSENGQLFHQLEMVQRISPQIPAGDLYIMEDCGFGRQRQDFQRSQFTAMLLTSLQVIRGKNEENVVALVKPSLKNKIYNGFVGSERVSLQNHVVDLMEERSQTDCVIIPKELKERYFRLKPSSREDMAQALLLATAFINVILNKRTLQNQNAS